MAYIRHESTDVFENEYFCFRGSRDVETLNPKTPWSRFRLPSIKHAVAYKSIIAIKALWQEDEDIVFCLFVFEYKAATFTATASKLTV